MSLHLIHLIQRVDVTIQWDQGQKVFWKSTSEVLIRGILVPFPKVVHIQVLPGPTTLGRQLRTRRPLSLLRSTEEETEAQASESRATQLRVRGGTGMHRLLFQCSLNIHSPSQAGRPRACGTGEPGLGGEQEGPDSSQ